MKHNNTSLKILLFSVFFLLSLSSCKKEEKDIIYAPSTPEQEEIENFKVTITQGETSASTCKLNFVPSDKKTPYVSIVVPRSVSNIMVSKDLYKHIEEQLKKEAKAQNKSLEAYLNSLQMVGDQSLQINSLNPHTAYTVLSFKKEESKLYPIQANEQFFFSTQVADKIDLHFEVTTKVEGNRVVLSVTPSNKEARCYMVLFPRAQYNKLLEQGLKDQDMISQHLHYSIQNMIYNNGLSLQEALDKALFSGDKQLEANGLEVGTEYVYLLGAFVVPDENTFFLASDLGKGSFETEKVELEETSFDIQISNQTDSKFDVKITPENKDLVYLWRFAAFTDETMGMNADELAAHIMKNTPFIGPWDRNKGELSYKNLGVNAGEKYYVIAFGFKGKSVSTKASMKTFTTGEAPDPSKLTFDTEITSLSPYSAMITFKPSDKRVYYAMALLQDGKVSLEALKKQFEGELQSGYEQFEKMNPGRTMQDYIGSYYFHGLQPYQFNSLKPENSYTLFTFALTKEGKVAAANEIKSYLQTPKLSEARLNAELFGVFNGNEVDDTMVNNPEAAKNKAVVILKYNFEKAAEGFAFMVPQTFRKAELNPDLIPDDVVLERLKFDFLKITKDSPYALYTCNWDETQVSISYAKDDKGITGLVSRKAIATPQKDKTDPIEKLRKLIKSLDDKEDPNSVAPASSKLQLGQDFSSILTIAKRPKALAERVLRPWESKQAQSSKSLSKESGKRSCINKLDDHSLLFRVIK